MRPTVANLTPLGLALAIGVALAAAGCGRAASRANIELRKEIQSLRGDVRRLTAANDQLRGDVRRLESSATTLPTLPADRLAQLWTVAGLGFGRLTGVDDRADGRPLRVALRPLDTDGATLKAAGAITIEAFDLDAQTVRLARWEFPADDIKQYWLSGGLVNEYVFTLTWPGDPPPPGTKLLVRATFTDALTGRTFEARRDVVAPSPRNAKAPAR